MARTHNPHHGSMQYWPRVRAKRQYATVRSWNTNHKDALLGFMGYKVGMTHVMAIDNRKTSATKGEEIFIPVTVIECPPLKIAGIRLYKQAYEGKQVSKDIIFKTDKDLSRKVMHQKVAKDHTELDKLNAHEYTDVRVMVYSQPRLAGVSKKKPEICEIALPGTVSDTIKYIKDKIWSHIQESQDRERCEKSRNIRTMECTRSHIV